MPGRTPPHVAMMAAGRLPDAPICGEILCVWSAKGLESLLLRLWWTILYPIAETCGFSGIKQTGSPFARTAMIGRLALACNLEV